MKLQDYKHRANEPEITRHPERLLSLPGFWFLMTAIIAGLMLGWAIG